MKKPEEPRDVWHELLVAERGRAIWCAIASIEWIALVWIISKELAR